MRSIFLAFLFAILASSLQAGPADFRTYLTAADRVIKGANVPVYSYVYNVAQRAQTT